MVSEKATFFDLISESDPKGDKEALYSIAMDLQWF